MWQVVVPKEWLELHREVHFAVEEGLVIIESRHDDPMPNVRIRFYPPGELDQVWLKREDVPNLATRKR